MGPQGLVQEYCIVTEAVSPYCVFVSGPRRATKAGNLPGR